MAVLSAARQALTDFGRNLMAGLRLAFGVPVSLLSFRVSVRQFVLLAVLSIVFGIVNDYLRAGPGATLSPRAIVYEGFEVAVLLFMGALLSAAYRQPHLLLALPGNQGGLWGYRIQWIGFWLLIVWIAVIYWRSVAIALVPKEPRFWWRSLAGGLLLLLGVPLAIWAGQPWFNSSPAGVAPIATYANPASEDVLIKQPQLLYDELTSLEDERPGVIDLYFVGFAP